MCVVVCFLIKSKNKYLIFACVCGLNAMFNDIACVHVVLGGKGLVLGS